MSAHKLHTPGPYIVRGEIEAGAPGYAMGADPATETAPGGYPYFIREDREFPAGSGPLWLAHGIQRKADADLFAAAPDMLAALKWSVGMALEAILVREAGDDPADTPEIIAMHREALEAAEAAIAKAEGKL